MMSTEPDYEAAIGSIKYLSVDELKDMMNNEDKISHIVNDLPQLKNMSLEKESLLKSTKASAEFNLTYQNKLSEGRNDLINKNKELINLTEVIAELESQISSSSSHSKCSIDTIQALLQTSAHELEDKSEDMVNNLLDNELSVDDFLSTFVPLKTIAHGRRIRSEKVTEMIRKGKIQTESSKKPLPYPGSASPSYPLAPTNNWSTPYPTQPMRMPMPGL